MTTILVVDDSALDRTITGACVEEQGLSAIYAENGQQAMEILERNRPDAVLTDLQMPEMDGLQLVKKVRRDYPSVPVLLMTAFGSEDIAAEALRAGAASYVPKKKLRETIGDALRAVLVGVQPAHQRDRVRQFLLESEAKFKLGYEPDGPQALISYLQDGLRRLNFCDDVEIIQISTALSEAITNAIDHGNLELDSALREQGDYRKLGDARCQQPPFRDRRVYVTFRLTESEASFAVRDEGKGFDPLNLPDPTDPENLTRVSGRGVMLIRTFMDKVRFSDSGNEITMVKRRAGKQGR
jgi:CheY-like chemotaxis protein